MRRGLLPSYRHHPVTMPKAPASPFTRRTSTRIQQLHNLSQPALPPQLSRQLCSNPVSTPSSLSSATSRSILSSTSSASSVIIPSSLSTSYLPLNKWLSLDIAPIRAPAPRRWKGKRAGGTSKQARRRKEESAKVMGEYMRKTREDEAGCWVLPPQARRQVEQMLRERVKRVDIREWTGTVMDGRKEGGQAQPDADLPPFPSSSPL